MVSVNRYEKRTNMAYLPSVLLATLLLLKWCAIEGHKAKHKLYIGGFLPFEEPNLEKYKNIQIASEIALKLINSSPHILRDYELQIIWNDSKVQQKKIFYWLLLKLYFSAILECV